ncbi:Anti-sigma-K factor rskA [Cohnella sp. OV330]|uniref:anti-sigma factor n=1 Tax=Cohnella sp. OV330 TaxID=1855288 RepID=UPI0008F25E57|nr:anti-sigma factor [Cohnella sp. OV330]SFB19527.1 Anti-sigma-K factor rskA [Cohnella sp. OV330]
MNERSCGVPEERWVDLLSGRLNARDAQALLAHGDGCRDCGDVYAQWAALLGGERGPSNLPAGRDAYRPADRAAPRRKAASADFAARPGEALALSAGRRRSLLLRAGIYAYARRATRALLAAARRPAFAAACGLGATVAVALLLLHPFAREDAQEAGNVLSPAGYARLHEPEGVSVLGEPDTVVYKSGESGLAGMKVGLPAGAKETLWVNARTHELFLLMEGLLPSARTDVQAWARSGATSANLGLLSFHDSRAHLYAANIRPEEWESVLLTIEPKGGSLTPTEPETVSIPLREMPE